MRFNYLGVSMLITASLAMSGCTAVLSDVVETWKYATERSSDAELSPQEIQEFPYTALYAQRGGQPRALIVLGFIDGAEDNARLQWVSSQREVIETNNGRIIQTFQFSPDLLSVTNLGEDPLRCLRDTIKRRGFDGGVEQCEKEWSFSLEVDKAGARSTIAMSSRFTIEGVDDIERPSGRVEQALKVREQVMSHTLKGKEDYSFDNLYWLAADGLVLRSHQTYLPGESMIKLDVVKWVGR